jgi:GT2 family glycosyltransferase
MDLKHKIKSTLWTLLPAESLFRQRLRKIYHQMASSSLIINFQIRRSKQSYKGWLNNQQKQIGTFKQSNPCDYRFAFLLEVDASNLEKARKTLKSIFCQTINTWEIIIVCSKETDTTNLFSNMSFENGKIRLLTEESNPLPLCLKASSSDYFLCCQPGDVFEINFLHECYKSIKSKPDAAIFYSDIDELLSTDSSPIPLFKPDQYSPELHLSKNFLSSALFLKNIALEKCEQINPEYHLCNQEWELGLLLTEENVQLQHIPLVLIHKDSTTNNFPQQECLLIKAHLKRIGKFNNIVVEKKPETKIKWDFDQPSVSIIIPTKNKLVVLKHLLDSLFKYTEYKNYELILVDNKSDETGISEYYAQLEKYHPVKIVHFDEKFNYSKALNFGASNSNSKLLLFLNNDMEITHPDWLTELAQWVMIPEIGIVGAKLLHADSTIQHAGIILGLQNFVGHIYINTPDHYHGLTGSVDWYRNISAVTGACQIIRREVFDELNGFDENFELIFSDIDICLRAILKGYRNLYTPNTVIKHLEGASRGNKDPIHDILRGYDLFADWIMKADPYFSQNLTYTTIPQCSIGNRGNQNKVFSIIQKRKYLENQNSKLNT